MASVQQSEIVRLAQRIASDTAIYDDHLRSQGHPSPSHTLETPPVLDLPKEIKKRSESIVEATTELQTLVLGPAGHIQNQLYAHTNLIYLHAVYRFKLASSFPVGEEASFEHISRKTGVNLLVLQRTMRYAVTKHIFHEPRPGVVAHTATSRAIAESPGIQAFLGAVLEEMWPAATKTVDAMAKWQGSEEPAHTGYALAHGFARDAYTELGARPERAARFAQLMELFNSNPDLSPRHLFEAFDWRGVRAFVDLGGSVGATAVALAARAGPALRCVVQDQPALAAQARAAIPEDLRDRIEFMPHDFFEEQPVRGADVYHFRWIFHNWGDKYCVKILRALVPALRPGSRVIVSDFLVPAWGTASAYQEWKVRAFDMAMFEMFNSKERSEEEWRHLFREADSRFTLKQVKQVDGSDMVFIEAVWEG